MAHTLLRWLASLLLAGVCYLPASAQAPDPDKERRPPAPEYALAGLAVSLVLLVVCMPNRRL